MWNNPEINLFFFFRKKWNDENDGVWVVDDTLCGIWICSCPSGRAVWIWSHSLPQLTALYQPAHREEAQSQQVKVSDEMWDDGTLSETNRTHLLKNLGVVVDVLLQLSGSCWHVGATWFLFWPHEGWWINILLSNGWLFIYFTVFLCTWWM